LALFSLLILLLSMRPAYTPNSDIVLGAMLGFGGFAAFHAHAGEVFAAEPLLGDSAAELADPAEIFETVLLAGGLFTLLRGLAAESWSTFAPWLVFWLLLRVLFWLVWRAHVPASSLKRPPQRERPMELHSFFYRSFYQARGIMASESDERNITFR
jgi:hypothetical protein